MDFLKLLLLAVIQGLTEFLPVSSSGHLALAKHFLGFESDGGVALEVMLHAGTLLSVVAFFRKRIWKILTGLVRREAAAWQYAACLLLSCLPAGVLYAFAGKKMEALFAHPAVVALFLMGTGLLLLSLRFRPRWLPGTRPLGWRQALGIGVSQAIAMLPGISRSGSTYTSARWLGIQDEEAFDFSFLMSVPVIGGAVLLKARKFGEIASGGAWQSFVAFAVAGVVGYGALCLLAKLRIAGKFWHFGSYCLAVGACALLLCLLRG